LKNPTKTVERKRFALGFPAHPLEGFHMSLFVGDNHDPGGNGTQIRFFDRGSNLHRLWDSDRIARAGDTEEFWLGELSALDTAENRAAWIAGAVEVGHRESARCAGSLLDFRDRRAAQAVPGAW
jgi:hypothetical protein